MLQPIIICAIAVLLVTNTKSVLAFENDTFNPIIRPEADDVARPGSTFLVQWEVTSTGPVSLFVRNSGDDTGIVIADSISVTTGQYIWNVPKALGENTTDPFDPYQFEMRIYDGSLGLTTLDVSPFEDTRNYSVSQGYFAITNDTTFTPPPLDTAWLPDITPAPLPTPTRTHTPKITFGDGSSTSSSNTGPTTQVTRLPTFEAVISRGHAGGLRYWRVAVIGLGILIGGAVI